jgi:hypothetical protein
MTHKKDNNPGSFGALPPPYVKLKSRRMVASDVELGRKMRAMYDDLLNQPIPERFVELLKQLDQARGKSQ